MDKLVQLVDNRVRFILSNGTNAVQFVAYFNSRGVPEGMDLGYHAAVPQYEGQPKNACDIFGTCYYDGTSLGASDVLADFAAAEWDVEWLWNYLEARLENLKDG